MVDVLVFGNGLVGKRISATLREAGRSVAVASLTATGEDGHPLDIRDREAVMALIAELTPQQTVFAAGVGDVEWAHTHRSQTTRINMYGACNVADGCEASGSELYHISTASVFDGYQGGYDEEAWPVPLNLQAKTMLLAEQQIEKRSCPSLSLRTGPLYGTTKAHDPIQLIRTALKAGSELRLVDDAKRDFTHVDHLAAALRDILAAGKPGCLHPGGPEALTDIQHAKRPGIYHGSAPDALSPYAFGVKAAEALGLNSSKLVAVHLREAGYKAERPLLATLDSGKLAADFSISFPASDQGLALLKGGR